MTLATDRRSTQARSAAARWSSSSTTKTARTRATCTMAASWVTPEAINFMLRWARGLVCMPARRPCSTSSTIGADGAARRPPAATPRSRARSTTSTPAAASAPPTARSRSAGSLDRRRRPERLPAPGSRVPAAGPPGGVLERRGHTEAAVDLARLAGLPPVAVICEVLARRRLAAAGSRSSSCSPTEHRIAMVSVDQIVEHRLAAADADAPPPPRCSCSATG